MKVFITEPLGQGGLLQFSYQLSGALTANGIDTTLVTGVNYELESYPHDFEVHKFWRLWQKYEKIFANRTLSNIARFLLWQREWIRFTLLVLREKPDIIVVGTIFSYPLVWVYLNIIRLSGVKITQICHEFAIREAKKNPFTVLFKKINDQAYNFLRAIFFLSDNQRKAFSQTFTNISEANLHVIPMGNANLFLEEGGKSVQEMRQQYGIESNIPVVLLFGRLATDKGISDLIEAFGIIFIEKKHRPCHLVIAGPPVEDKRKWLDQIENLNIKKTVTVDARYIPSTEIEPLMKMASVVVYPYRNASQSFSLQVAYSFGRPVIATRVGGLPEDVENGKSGIVVDPLAPHQLADAITTLIDDPSLAKSMGEYALELSKTKHSWNNIGKLVADVFRQL